MNLYKVILVGIDAQFSGMAIKPAHNPVLAINAAIRDMPQNLWGSIDTVTATKVGEVNPVDQPRIVTPNG